MTIDEAIAKEEKYIAVNKAKYEFECRYYGKDTVERGPKLDCVNEYEYHMKIVELLEELKKRRNEDYGYLADIYQSIGYRKAIDDLRNELKNHYTEYNIDCVLADTNFYSYTTACNYLEDYIDEISKQLKVGE